MLKTILNGVANWIYKQLRGTCIIHAVANALEKQTGVVVPEEELVAIYKNFNNGSLEGMSDRRLLDILQHEPIGGYVVDSYERVYNIHDFWRDNNNAKKKRYLRSKLNKVWEALKNDEGTVIFGIYTRKGSTKIKLDEDNYWMPYETEITGGHYLYLLDDIRTSKRQLKGFRVENSWGEKWGDGGFFNMKLKDFFTEVESVYTVKFKKI